MKWQIMDWCGRNHDTVFWAMFVFVAVVGGLTAILTFAEPRVPGEDNLSAKVGCLALLLLFPLAALILRLLGVGPLWRQYVVLPSCLGCIVLIKDGLRIKVDE